MIQGGRLSTAEDSLLLPQGHHPGGTFLVSSLLLSLQVDIFLVKTRYFCNILFPGYAFFIYNGLGPEGTF